MVVGLGCKPAKTSEPCRLASQATTRCCGKTLIAVLARTSRASALFLLPTQTRATLARPFPPQSPVASPQPTSLQSQVSSLQSSSLPFFPTSFIAQSPTVSTSLLPLFAQSPPIRLQLPTHSRWPSDHQRATERPKTTAHASHCPRAPIHVGLAIEKSAEPTPAFPATLPNHLPLLITLDSTALAHDPRYW